MPAGTVRLGPSARQRAVEPDPDASRPRETAGRPPEDFPLDRLERASATDVVGRARADHHESPMRLRPPPGRAVGASLESQINGGSADAEASDRQLRQPGRESRAHHSQYAEWSERVQAEHHLDQLHERTGRPCLWGVGARVRNRSRNLARTMP